MAITDSRLRTEVEHARQAGYIPVYRDVARRYGFTTALLLGKDSRESCLGLCLDAQFKGDAGNGWGLSQIDRRFHPAFTSSHDPRDHRAVIEYGARLLREETDRFTTVREGLVAYNAGPDAVIDAQAQGLDVDAFTTGGDYSRDVLSRANRIAKMYPEYGKRPVVADPGWIVSVLLGGGMLYLATDFYRNRVM